MVHSVVKVLPLFMLLLLVHPHAESLRHAGQPSRPGADGVPGNTALPAPAHEFKTGNGTLMLFTPTVNQWNAYSELISVVNLGIQLENVEQPLTVSLHIRTGARVESRQRNQLSCKHEILRVSFPNANKTITDRLRGIVLEEMTNILRRLPLNLCWPKMSINTVKVSSTVGKPPAPTTGPRAF